MFLDAYARKLKTRFPSFQLALNWFEETGGRNIVETGCVRRRNDWSAGMSTVLFGRYVADRSRIESRHDLRFWTVDNSSKCLDVAKRVCGDLPVNYLLSDSLIALADWTEPIDLLYLDSLDCDPRPGSDNSAAQSHSLREFEAAFHALSRNAVIIIDDNDFGNGGKAQLTNQRLAADAEFVRLWSGKQAVWVRNRA